MKRVKNYYTSNPILRDEIAKSKIVGQPTDRLARAIMMIATNMGRKGNFVGYSYRDEMECEGILAMLNGWHKFNPEKSDNPFAYLSTICMNAFRRTLTIHKRQADIRDALLFAAGLPTSLSYADREA